MATEAAGIDTPTLDQARQQLRRYGLESEADPRAVLVAVRLLATGARLGQATEAHFARFGLSTGRYRMLADLEDSAGEKSPSQLAASLGVTRATVTGLIDSLEQEGLVLRRPSAEDGRAVVVVLTARGAQKMRDIAPEHFGRLQAMVSGLSPQERTTFLELLGRITEGIGALTAP
ncbi:MarR family winged helix-turn-helix transcriptional regulator [Nocardia sp. NBC_01327]|uniref:MarR family winged helix-turn-helix transcriptional regulator n=1 Tax=Nocardia sp. NBC_01327 TaxID=2903593 RepID=UPI002E1302EC|nr:MarR family transcriptional regulator [Nocardia sp. NBC_01327]